MKMMIRIPMLLLSGLLFGLMACGQEKPAPQPEVEVTLPAKEIPFPPAVSDNVDRSGYKVRSYGKHPIQLATDVKLIGTGDRVPENARSYIVLNETWSGKSDADLQLIVNMVEYQPSVKVDVQAISDFAVEQLKADVAVADLKSRNTTLSIPGAATVIRVDGTLFRDGLIHYWFLVTVGEGQHMWQITGIYPETNKVGPGDAEAIIQSIKVLP